MRNRTRWILISSFIASLIVFSSVLGYGISQFEDVRNLSRNIVKSNNTKSEIVITMLSSARERVLDLFGMVNSDDPFIRDDLFLDFNKQGATFAAARAELLKLELSEDEKKILEKQGILTSLSVPIQNELVDLIQADEIDQAKDLLNETGVEAQNKVLDELAKLLELQKESSRDILGKIDHQYEISREHILTWSSLAFVFGAIIAFMVISKMSRTEHRLFDEIENARAILTSINDVILKINKEGSIVFANEKAKKIFGSDIGEHRISKYLPFINVADLFKSEDDVIEKLGVFEIENKSGKLWVEVMLETIRNEEGEETGKLLVLHDQTEIINAQNRLRLANENLEIRVNERTVNLQQSNAQLKETLDTLAKTNQQMIHSEKMASLGGLVAGISHEINTPVGVGVTAATNIEENVKSLENLLATGKLTKSEFESSMANTRKGLDILIKNLRRASDLIKSFKQVAVDQSSDELRHIDIKHYFDEIILSLHPKLKQTNISVKNNTPDGIMVHTNPGAIYQIISNLVVNSIVHAFEHGVENEEIELDASLNDDDFVLEYRDNGKGLDDETLARVFDPFFTTKRGQGGSGLGMNVVYNLVTTSLNGEINIDSEPEKGLYVAMSIPLVQS